MLSPHTFRFQVIYGGAFSNRTLALMIKRSPLIEVFRSCHETVEENFYLKDRTTRHAPSDMESTRAALRTHMEKHIAFDEVAGRVPAYLVPEQLAEGLGQLQTISESIDEGEGDDEAAEIGRDDLVL